MNITESKIKPLAWFQKYALQSTAFLFWMALLAGYQWYAWRNDLSPVQVVQQLLGFMTGSLRISR